MSWHQRYGHDSSLPHSLPPHTLTPYTQGVFVFVTVGGKKGAGQFLLAGSDEDVAALGPKSAVDVVLLFTTS